MSVTRGKRIAAWLLLFSPVINPSAYGDGVCPIPECGPDACVALKAVAINNVAVSPTSCVTARPGDTIKSELFISGWGGQLGLLRLYQVKLDLHMAAESGTFGTLLPVGWDSPFDLDPCNSAADCAALFPVCSLQYGCVGPAHDPDLGVGFETGRADFIFIDEIKSLVATAVDNSSLFYRYLGLLDTGVAVPDPGTPRYAGTLLLTLSAAACGDFTVPILSEADAGITFLGDAGLVPRVVFPVVRPLRVSVCNEDDGLFCNGTEVCDTGVGCLAEPPDCDDGTDCTEDRCNDAIGACDPQPRSERCDDGDPCTTDICTPSGCTHDYVLCGACCDSWLGECEEGVFQSACTCPNCVWSSGVDCDADLCRAEFVDIPTLSHWGILVLTLGLLSAGKIRFRRQGSAPRLGPA